MIPGSYVREKGEIIISSGARLTVETSGDFLQVLKEALEVSERVAIEFEPAVEIDIAGLQILCSACRSAAQRGKAFSYRGLQPQALTGIIISCGAESRAFCTHNNDFTCIWFGGAK